MRSPSIENIKKVSPDKTFKKKLKIPTSKSRANRMLFLASITPGEVILENMPDSSDVIDMIRSLKMIGLKIEVRDDTVIVYNHFPACENLKEKEPIKVECGYGGTTTRFLAGLLALGSKEYYLEPSGHMRSRPMKELKQPLEALGVKVDFDFADTWMIIQGPVLNKLKHIEVDTSRSTQFASAIAMTMSLWGGNVKPLNLHSSEDYFKMTLDCIEKAKSNDWKISIDFSSLSYPIALAALCGEVEILNYSGRDKMQPDSIFIDILKEMGVKIEETENSLKVLKAKNIIGWSGDCSAFPDLVPTLCFINAFSGTEVVMAKLEVLKHKESDRLNELSKILGFFNIENEIISDSIKIYKCSPSINKVTYKAPDDHRMIMVTALFMRMLGGGEIYNFLHVKKSYPYFFEDIIE